MCCAAVLPESGFVTRPFIVDLAGVSGRIQAETAALLRKLYYSHPMRSETARSSLLTGVLPTNRVKPARLLSCMQLA